MDKPTDSDSFVTSPSVEVRPAAPPTSGKPDSLKATIRANRLAAAKIASRRLAAAARRLELREQLDWVQPWSEVVQQAGPWNTTSFGPASRAHRRKGQDFPIYRTEVQLNILRAASRALLANNCFAKGQLVGLGNYVVGGGYTYRAAAKATAGDGAVPPSLVEALQKVIDETLKINEWQGGELPPIEEEAFNRSFEDGEFLLRSFYRNDGMTLVRFPEPEQLTQPNSIVESGFDWGFGIRSPARDIQTATAYWLVYGETPDDGDLCEPNEITHYCRNRRRNMKRGFPEFSFGTHDLFDIAQELAANLGAGAAEQAAIASVMQTDNGTADEIQAINLADADGTIDNPLGGGSRDLYRRARRRSNEWIGGGQRYVEGPAATNTSGHIAALDAILRAAGRPFQSPEWLTSGNGQGMNYATSLTAESPFTIWVKNNQKGYKSAFSRVIWSAVEHYVRTCEIRANGRTWTWSEVARLVELVVEAPDPVSRDPLADAQRFGIEMPMSVDSPQAYCERNGRDYDRIQKDLEEHVLATGGSGDLLELPLELPPEIPQ